MGASLEISSQSSPARRHHAGQRGDGEPRRHLHDPRRAALLPVAALLRRLLETTPRLRKFQCRVTYAYLCIAFRRIWKAYVLPLR